MFVGDSQDHSFNRKMQRCQDYIDALQAERQKILVFQRELPLCLELVTQAIEACKQQLPETTTATAVGAAQSECNSEQTTSDGPVFEEFIPMKRKLGSGDLDEQESQKSKSDNEDCSEKSDWLGSAQLSLWNQSSDPVISPRKVPVKEVKRSGGSGGAFQPFKREKSDRTSPTPLALPSPSAPAAAEAEAVVAASSTADVVGKKKDDRDEQGQRKARRCWSPELHRRFLQALQQLGGSHVATPKQIRDLMKVDGLTNDEVKSHLQKYRLHTRRPTPTIHNSNTNTAPNHYHPQAPQFVVVGGIWVPPPASNPTPAAATRNGVYAPIATPAVPLQQMQRQQQQLHQSRSSNSEERASHSGDTNSPANSSSTHTTAS